MIWVFPRIGVPQNGWFIMENPIKVEWFGGTTILGNPHMCLRSFFHLGKAKNSGPWDVPSLPLRFYLQDDHQTASWSATCYFPPSKLSWTNTIPPKKKIRSFFYLKIFLVARSENVTFYRSGSPKKMRPACQLASASALIAAFLARNSRFWASSKDSPCCLPHLFDRKKTNEKSQVSEDYWL